MSITRQKICFHRSGSTLQISRFNLTQMQILSITTEHIVDDSFHPQINENTTEIFSSEIFNPKSLKPAFESFLFTFDL